MAGADSGPGLPGSEASAHLSRHQFPVMGCSLLAQELAVGLRVAGTLGLSLLPGKVGAPHMRSFKVILSLK